MSNEVNVTLHIQDEQGRPVPYVTVWRYLQPREGPLAIDGDDLWRLTTRYQSSFEFALDVGLSQPVRKMTVCPMGDGAGQFHSTINYRYEEGSAAQLPDKMSFGFTVMKRGYLPARIDFNVTDESAVSGRVVLERDPKQPVETQPYLMAFERLRYELSDTRRNEDISEANHQRIESLRRQLEAAARQAIDAGDKKAAARIYARMDTLPSVTFINGKPAGFSQTTPDSEQSPSYYEKAYALDPSNSFIASMIIFDEGTERFGGNKYKPEQATDAQRRAFADYLRRLNAFMRTYGPELWPGDHKLYALWLRKSSDPKERARIRPLLEELYRAEPKYETREELFGILEELGVP